MLFRRTTAVVCTAALTALTAPAAAFADTGTASAYDTAIIIDGSTADTGSPWRGFGCADTGCSSRLLLDYRSEQPEEYDRLLRLFFDPEGPLKISSLRLEPGSPELLIADEIKKIAPDIELTVSDDTPADPHTCAGAAPGVTEKYAANADGSGISGASSMLDVARRIAGMYADGGFTMYEFQPAAAACYSGAEYLPGQLVTACEPWSGYTEAGGGFFMAEHFSLFSEPGWQFVKSGCSENCMTLTDPQTGDYSVIFVNNSGSEQRCAVDVKNIVKADRAVQVWETRAPDEGQVYNNNYLRNIMSVTPERQGGSSVYTLTVKPYSIVTVTTLSTAPEPLSAGKDYSRLTLPYSDDFEYADYPENYLTLRENAPRYTNDISGSFKVTADDKRGSVLEQKLTEKENSNDPVTTFGDDSWANYSVTAGIKLADGSADNYAGVAARYINSAAPGARSGYSLLLYGDGSWQLRHMNDILDQGSIHGFDPDVWHTVSVLAEGDVISAGIDGSPLSSVKIDGAVTFSGRAALLSAYENNKFDDLEIVPSELTSYVNRVDELDNAVKYSDSWTHDTSDSFTCHYRTTSETSDGSLEFSFEGDSLALIGRADNAQITVEIDGSTAAESEQVNGSAAKEAFWHRYSLGYGEHTAKVTVNSGTVKFDALEYGSDTQNKDGSGSRLSELHESNDPLVDAKPRKNRPTFKAVGACLAAGVAVYLIRRRKRIR